MQAIGSLQPVARVSDTTCGWRHEGHVARRPACGLARVVPTRVVLAAVFTLGLSACADGKDEAAPPTSAPTAAPSPSASATTSMTDRAQTLEAEVVAAYEAASQAFLDAAAIPDPDFPALAQTHVDPMLDQRRGVLTQLKFEGRVIRLPADSVRSIEAESFEAHGDGTAVLVVCIIDDGERYDAATGELLTDGRPGTSRFRAALRNVDGRWVLAEQLLEEEWPGVAGCAAD